MGRLFIGLVCSLAVFAGVTAQGASSTGGAGAGEPTNPCAATTCPVDSICEVDENGNANCVTSKPNPCAYTSCVTGTTCEVGKNGEANCVGPDTSPCAAIFCAANSICQVNEKGEAECVPIPNDDGIPDDPCVVTTCLTGTICTTDKNGQAQCIENPCNLVDCQPDSTCVVNSDNEAVCEELLTTTSCDLPCPDGQICSEEGGTQQCVDAPYDPCIATTCLENTACITNEAGQAECIPVQTVGGPQEGSKPCNLACVKGKMCVVKNGKAACVKEVYNPCAATTCPFGYSCVPEGKKGVCLSPCAAVRCRAGYKCTINKKGNAQCVLNKPKKCKKKCRKGFRCGLKNGKVQCVSKCYKYKCKKSQRCIVSKKGKATCIPKQKPRRGLF